MIGQTFAILLDQYRQLNNRRLFWIALALSGLVVLAFALVGVKDGNLSVVTWRTGIPLTALGFTPSTLYKLLFLNFGVNFWLAWLTTILALVTTAGLIPDFITGGAIDLALSKPIGRARLFFTKYLAGLLFVALQISVFTVASFVVLGVRGGDWEPAVFLAIPLIIIFFSYLFSVCVLIGLLTRSTVASLLATLLFWFLLFALNTAEIGIVSFQKQAEVRVERLESRVESFRLAAERKPLNMLELAKQAISINPPQARLEAAEEELAEARADAESLAAWHRPFYIIKTALPKTSETVNLLRRALVELAELPEFQENAPAFMPPDIDEQQRQRFEERIAEGRERTQLLATELQGRSIAWVLGSSLVFEGVILVLACRIFVRRDF